MFDYRFGTVGDPFPETITLLKGETASGVILYVVPEKHSTSGMQALYVLDGENHIWQY
jgi:hypothetical protein